MADLVVGLAKSVVDGVLTKAQAAIEEEAKLRKSAQRDLVFITGEFQMMQSFLNVANDERIENKVVRTWVSQIRELAYDVEDCIEFVIHLNKKTTWWFRVVPSWMVPTPSSSCCSCVVLPSNMVLALKMMLELDQAVDEIEQVKARVADVSERNARYNLISDSGSKQAVLKYQQPESFFSGAGGVAASNMLVEARDAFKRRQRFGDLGRLITATNTNDGDHLPLQVISVWGAAGDHGTTSIIRKAYNDPEVRRSFQCWAWVKLTHPFNPDEFVRGFMAHYYANSSEQRATTIGMEVRSKMKKVDEASLFEEFEKLVKKKYLVVLEDLSDMVEWDAARTFLPDNNNGSCIIVSAQQCEIASLCIGHPYQIRELKKFSADHSVCALFKKDSLGDGRHNKGKKAVLTRDETLVPSSSYSNTLSPNKAEAEEWKKSTPLIGRDPQMNELCKYPAMARTNSNPVMAVWGIAGVGKSAVVRDLYYSMMLKEFERRERDEDQQFDKYGWVEMSYPFNMREFYVSLLVDDARPETYTVEEYCRRLVKDCRCLIVVDGLRSTEEWDQIQPSLVHKDSRSVVVVVTTESSVAKHCTNNEDSFVFNVKALEAAAAIDFFESQVKKGNPNSTLKVRAAEAAEVKKGNPNSTLKVDGVKDLEDLVRRCGGLPKVIAAIAEVMATRTVTLTDTARSLNSRFMHHLETKPEYDSLRDLFHWMHSYFRTCPDSLKPCIIYLAIFPRDRIIRRRRLVRRWVAEGYSKDSNNESAEKNGEDQFSELLQLSIVQQPPDLVTTASMADKVKMVKCQVNSFIREYVVARQMDENLVFELGGRCGLTTQRTGRHLVVLKDWARDRVVFKSIEFSRLRSLTVFGPWESFFISESMKMLRVLDLEDAEGPISDSDLDKLVELLHRLKFLSLRGHTEITRLPALLGHLRHLQTLDVRGTSITSLPANIAKLDKLQYVRAGAGAGKAAAVALPTPWYRPRFLGSRQRVGVEVPRKSIRKLTALHTLGVVNVDASGGDTMVKELTKLTQLRKLGASGINRHNSKSFFSAICKYGHLESLSVQFDKENQAPMDDIVLPWKTIHSLKLYGLQDRLPCHDRPLPEDAAELTKLNLTMEKLETAVNLKTATEDNDMRFLGKLPKLRNLHLRLDEAATSTSTSLKFDLRYCGLGLPIFEKVKILEIACSSPLQLTFGSETMKSLELLKLDCTLAAGQLPQLNHLPQLKEVLLKSTNSEETKIALKSQFENQERKPVVESLKDNINQQNGV